MAYVICAEWKSNHESKTVPFTLCYASSERHIWTSDSNAALEFNSADEAEAWWHEHFNEMTAHPNLLNPRAGVRIDKKISDDTYAFTALLPLRCA